MYDNHHFKFINKLDFLMLKASGGVKAPNEEDPF